MTAINPASFLGSEDDHTAIGSRMVTKATSGSLEGVVRTNDLIVTASSAALRVAVADGSAFVTGDGGTTQGTYHIINYGGSASVNLDAASHDPTFSRNDLIIARVRDSEYGDASSAWALEAVAGTANLTGSQTDPVIPASSLVLARCIVKGGTTLMTASGNSVEDLRPKVSTGYSVSAFAPGVLYSASGETGVGLGRTPDKGELFYDTTTERLDIYNGSAFKPLSTTATWGAYVPALTQGASVAITIHYASFARYGSLATGNSRIEPTSGGTAASVIECSAPATGISGVVGSVVGSFIFYDHSAAIYYSGSVILYSATIFRFISNGSSSYLGSSGFDGAVASPDQISFSYSYETSE